MVTTTSSRAIRSSSLTSPSAAMMRVRRSSPYLSTISVELVAHDRALTLRLGQNVLVVGDLELDLGEFVDDLLTLEGRQAAQLHREDGVGLDLVDVEQLDQSGPGDVDGLRRPDERDDLVQRVERLDQAAQDVGALFGLAEQVLGTPDDDLELVRRVQTDHLVEAQGARHTVDDGEHVAAEAGLQLGVLVQVVQHNLGHGVTLDRDDDAHADAVGGLVVDIGDAGDLGVTNLIRDRGDQVVRVDLVGQLGDDNCGAALGVLFDLDHTAHADGAAAGGVRRPEYPGRRRSGRAVGKSGPLTRSMTAARVDSSSAS